MEPAVYPQKQIERASQPLIYDVFMAEYGSVTSWKVHLVDRIRFSVCLRFRFHDQPSYQLFGTCSAAAGLVEGAKIRVTSGRL